MALCAGDWVEVRSKEEILRSLDENGCLDALPFMPEMFQYCGRRLRVFKRAHKTCDTINHYVGRRLAGCLHLEQARCDGQAHGGCQAACLLFWKEAWLKPIGGSGEVVGASPERRRPADDGTTGTAGSCSEDAVRKATRVAGTSGDETTYVCQATRLLDFTTPLRWWDLRQYVEDYASGNATVLRILRALSYSVFQRPNVRFPAFRALHDWVQRLIGGIPYPRRGGTLAFGAPTPTVELDLKPGEFVRVKSYEEILETMDPTNKHRGLFFDAELVPYCGGTYCVRTRVDRFIDEKTGKMRFMKTPAVILENVWCQSCYSSHRMLCPRSIYPWWREVWLDRVFQDSER